MNDRWKNARGFLARRVGANAAEAAWRARRCQVWFAVTANLFVLCVIIVSVWKPFHPQLVLVGLVIPTTFLMLRIWYRHQYFSYASTALGVNVNWRNQVPFPRDYSESGDQSYIEWCRTFGIEPYHPHDVLIE